MVARGGRWREGEMGEVRQKVQTSNNKINKSLGCKVQHGDYIVYLFFCLCPFRAAPAAFGGSQARGRIGAVAASLLQSHSNDRSKLSLQPTPQIMATPDPYPTE